VSGATIAAAGESLAGEFPYRFGGAPGANGRDGSDCSGFVNYVLGVMLGMAIPGYLPGAYKGTGHGPVVIQYASGWDGDVAVTAAQAAPGDLAVWPGLGGLAHIGIVTGKNQMVSALNPSAGTAVTPITGYGPPGVPQVFRRVKAAGSWDSGAAATAADSTTASAGCLGLPVLIAFTLITGRRPRIRS
jgi:cell wall-associated NlpC family hydrolase